MPNKLFQWLSYFLIISSNLLAQTYSNVDFSLSSNKSSAFNWTHNYSENMKQEKEKNYWLHTEVNIAEGEEFVGLLNIGINYQLLENNYLGLEFLMYERYGDYKYYPDYSSSNTALRLYIRHII